MAAVKWYFKHIVQSQAVWAVTDKQMITIKRDSENKGNGQVDGLGWSDVDFVCRFAESEQSIKGYRDSALIRLMSDCLLRISEAVAVNLEDLQDNALIVQSSKTDQTGEDVALYIGDRTIQIIKIYYTQANITSGALFRRIMRGDGSLHKCLLTMHGSRKRNTGRWHDTDTRRGEGYIPALRGSYKSQWCCRLTSVPHGSNESLGEWAGYCKTGRLLGDS